MLENKKTITATKVLNWTMGIGAAVIVVALILVADIGLNTASPAWLPYLAATLGFIGIVFLFIGMRFRSRTTDLKDDLKLARSVDATKLRHVQHVLTTKTQAEFEAMLPEVIHVNTPYELVTNNAYFARLTALANSVKLKAESLISAMFAAINNLRPGYILYLLENKLVDIKDGEWIKSLLEGSYRNLDESDIKQFMDCLKILVAHGAERNGTYGNFTLMEYFMKLKGRNLTNGQIVAIYILLDSKIANPEDVDIKDIVAEYEALCKMQNQAIEKEKTDAKAAKAARAE